MHSLPIISTILSNIITSQRSCFASLLHQLRNVPGRSSPQRIWMMACLWCRLRTPLGDKIMFLTSQANWSSVLQHVNQHTHTKMHFYWLFFQVTKGAQYILLLTEKVALIIQHTADTAPLMLNSKTMRSWRALHADTVKMTHTTHF